MFCVVPHSALNMRRQCPVLAAVQLLQVGLGVARIVVDGELAGHDVGGELVDKIDHVSQAHIARIVQVDEQQVLELDERFDVVADAQQPLVALVGGASYRADACSGMAWSYSDSSPATARRAPASWARVERDCAVSASPAIMAS